MQAELQTTELSRPHSRLFLVVVNLFVTLILFITLVTVYRYYEDRIVETTASEGRFILTEWQLLRELKLETDRQLLEKDREISELRQRYLLLSRQETGDAALQDLQRQLRIAEQEREALLQQRIDVPAAASEDLEIRPPASQRTDTPNLQRIIYAESTSLSRLLKSQIDTLQTQLKESQLYTEILEADLVATGDRIIELERDYQRATNFIEQISRFESAGEHSGISAEYDGVDLLETRLLVKVLARQPQFLQEYPDLPERLENYFAYLEGVGRVEGHSAAVQEMQSEVHAWLRLNQSMME